MMQNKFSRHYIWPSILVFLCFIIFIVIALNMQDYMQSRKSIREFNEIGCDFSFRHYAPNIHGYVVEMGTSPVTNRDVKHLLHILPKRETHTLPTQEIVTLNLAETRITDAGLKEIKSCTSLRELHLNNTNVSDQGLRYLAELKQLRILDLTNTKITGSGLKYLQSLPNLEVLLLSGTKLTNGSLDSMRFLKGIKSLAINQTAISDCDLEYVAAIPQLKNLSVGPMITDVGIEQIQGLKKLKKLAIERNVTDSVIWELKQALPSLEVIDYGVPMGKITFATNLTQGQACEKIKRLKGWASVDESSSNKNVISACLFAPRTAGDAPLALLEPLDQIQKLQLAGGWISDEGLQCLPPLKQLRILSFRAERWRDREPRQGKFYPVGSPYLPEYRDTWVSDKGIKLLGERAQLESLDLTGTYVTDEGLRFLDRLINLKELGLRNGVITGEGLKYVATLKNLELLDLSNTVVDNEALVQLQAFPKLKKLWLGRTLVTDAGLATLATLQGLEFLDLSHTPVTDQGILKLAKLKHLKEIDLDFSYVSEEGFAALQKKLPNLKLSQNARLFGPRAPRATDEELRERYAPFH